MTQIFCTTFNLNSLTPLKIAKEVILIKICLRFLTCFLLFSFIIWTQQADELKKETPSPPDVSTINSLKKYQTDNAVGLRKRNIQNNDCDTISNTDNEEYDNFEEENSKLIYYDNKIVAVKNNSLVKYDSVEKNIVEYKHTNFSLKAKKIIDDLTLNKLIKSPLVRKHDIINDTVDAWAKKTGSEISNLSMYEDQVSLRYKPLIFGGTYPIDVPTGMPNKCNTPRNIEYNEVKTFDIDRPFSFR